MRWCSVIILALLAVAAAACGSDSNDAPSGAAGAQGTTAVATAPAGSPTSIAQAAASAVAADLTGVFTTISRRLEAGGRIRELVQNPRVDDPEWQASIRAALEEMRASNTEVTRLRPVSCLPSLQTALQASTQQATQATDRLAEAVSQRNATAITEASQRLTESDRAIAVALASLENIRC